MTTTTTTPAADPLDALATFVCSRPGFEPRNYISGWHDVEGRRAYRADVRRATRDRNDALAIIGMFRHAMPERRAEFAATVTRQAHHRLTWDSARGQWDYCAGQYYCVEYRAAAMRLLANALADYYGGVVPARSMMPRSIARRWL